MQMISAKKYIVIALIIMFFASSNCFAFHSNKIIPEQFEENNTVEIRGYFFYQDHCFSVVIPEGVTGMDHDGPQSHHGFGAILSNDPYQAYLYVGTEPGGIVNENGDVGTLNDQAKKVIKQYINNGAVIIDKKIMNMNLDSLPAIRVTCNIQVISRLFAICPG